MSTTREQLQKWFYEGRRQGATHMLVICDTFDHSDYPVYVGVGQDPKKVANEKQYSRANMQRLMECYALHKEFDEQESNGNLAADYTPPPPNEKDPILAPYAATAIKRLLIYSFSAVNYDYNALTKEEKDLVSRAQFENIVQWLGVEREPDPGQEKSSLPNTHPNVGGDHIN